MTIPRSQLTLVAIFVTALMLHLACFAYALWSDAIYMENLQMLAVRILTVYSVPLGVIIGGMFGASPHEDAQAGTSTLWVAVALSLLWNLLLLSRSLLFAFAKQDSIVALLDYIDAVAAAGTFLIGGALAYYFAK